jgi:hypothetical protein
LTALDPSVVAGDHGQHHAFTRLDAAGVGAVGVACRLIECRT